MAKDGVWEQPGGRRIGAGTLRTGVDLHHTIDHAEACELAQREQMHRPLVDVLHIRVLRVSRRLPHE